MKICTSIFTRLVLLSIAVSACQKNEVKKVNRSETSPEKKNSKDLVLQHDIAISSWFHFQRASMNVISYDGQGNLRLKSHVNFSKMENSAEDVLNFQQAAIDEYVTNYGNAEVLNSWMQYQSMAAKDLKSFIELVGGDVTPATDDDYLNIIKTQRLYVGFIEKYREDYKKSSVSTIQP